MRGSETIRFTQRRDQGNAMIIALMMLLVLTAYSSSQYVITVSNMRQAEFMTTHGDLGSYAESGVTLAIHDLRFDVTGNEGAIGTTGWNALTDDLGRDGVASTGDEGEGDGYPTPGEPNLSPVSIGPASDGIQLIVHSTDAPYFLTKHIISTAFTDDVMSVYEVYVQPPIPPTIPQISAIYVSPNVLLNLKGNSFLIDGNDTNPDGSAGTEPALHGIATAESDPAGQNAADIHDQIPLGNEDQVIGAGGEPSITESPDTVDFGVLFTEYSDEPDRTVATGTYSSISWGDPSNYQITLATGDISLSGNGSGAGILLVDGSLTMSGDFTWEGLVMVRGDVKQTGGGSGVHIYGSLLVESSLSVVDDPEITVSGTADIKYSSLALNQAQSLLYSKATYYSVLYWAPLK